QEEAVVRKGRLQPGKLFLVDLEEGRVVEDPEIKERMATRQPYADWFDRCSVHFDDLPEAAPRVPRTEPRRERQLAFGYSQENLLDETPQHAHQLVMRQPVLRDHELERLRQVSHDVFRSRTIDITWPVAEGPEGMERAVERICQQAHDLVAEGFNVLILSDREVGAERVAIPSLLAGAAVHHHL